MSNNDNKTNPIQLIRDEWQAAKYALMLLNREKLFVCKDSWMSLTSHDGMTTLSRPVSELTSHEEANARLVPHCRHAAEQESAA